VRIAQLLINVLTRIESVFACLAYVVVAALLIGDVIGRELFSAPIHGAQKMAVYAAIVAGFIGLSLATSDNMHLRPSFLDNVLPAKFNAGIGRFSDVFACLFFLAMAIIGLMFVRESMRFEDKAAVLYWLLWPIQLIIPYAFLSTSFRHGLFAAFPALKPDTSPAH
jgi:TRAP-type C4-dicarboxylate transport system permease small subunit